MAQYRVILVGSNFLLEAEGQRGKFGFYTTRFVEAESDEDAVDSAIERLWEERDLDALGLNDPTDPPRVCVEEVEEVEAVAGAEELVPGLAFFSEAGGDELFELDDEEADEEE